MFDRPPNDELATKSGTELEEWLSERRSSDVLIVGGGLSGLLAGIVLGQEEYDTVLAEPSEELGGRLLWDSGPVPIFSPASELLDDTGFGIKSDPPFWVDRLRLRSFLVNEFCEAGGQIVTEAELTADPISENGSLTLDVNWNDRRETFTTNDLLSTIPVMETEYDRKSGTNPLQSMVKHTNRGSDDIVRAGFQTLPPEVRDRNEPFASALLLSGRKAAEIILNDREIA